MRRAAALLLLTMLSAGCAHQRLPGTPVADIERQAIAGHFDLRGKLAAAIQTSGYNARLEWQQRGEAFDITLSGPVGIGRTELSGTPEQATLRRSDGTREFDDPGEALAATFGVPLPLEELRFWAVGVPAPDRSYQEIPPADGAIRRFTQSGWQVDLLEERPADGRALPRRLSLTRGGTRLKLVVSAWDTSPL